MHNLNYYKRKFNRKNNIKNKNNRNRRNNITQIEPKNDN